MSKTGITCYRNGGCGPYEMRSCYECPASKSDYVQVKTTPTVVTNFDEIKAMSAEDFSAWISHIVGCPLNNFLEYSPIGKCVKKCKAKDCWVAWLKAPADKEATE